MLTLLSTLVAPLPIGTNLGLLHLLWMLVSGQLLATRGAVIPGLRACGLADRAVRRAWAALGQGDWTSGQLLARWRAVVTAEGRWTPTATSVPVSYLQGGLTCGNASCMTTGLTLELYGVSDRPHRQIEQPRGVSQVAVNAPQLVHVATDSSN